MSRRADVPTTRRRAPARRASCSPSAVDVEELERRPAPSTNVSPSSFVKNSLPSTATGDAEKPSRWATPSRPCHTDAAGWSLRPPSRCSPCRSPCRAGRRREAATARRATRAGSTTRARLRVTSPSPPGRIASVGPARPDEAKTRPWPDDRRWDDLHGRAAAAPELASRLRIVGLHAVLAVDDDFVVRRRRGSRPVFPSQRCASRAVRQTSPAGLRVERGDEGARTLVLIEDHPRCHEGAASRPVRGTARPTPEVAAPHEIAPARSSAASTLPNDA